MKAELSSGAIATGVVKGAALDVNTAYRNQAAATKFADTVPPYEQPSVLPEHLARLDRISKDIAELSSVAVGLLEKLAGPRPEMVPTKKDYARPGVLGALDDVTEQIVDQIAYLRESMNVLDRLA